MVVLLNKNGIWLPTTEHRHKTKVGRKGKRSLLKCSTTGGMGSSQASLFCQTENGETLKPKPRPEIPVHPYVYFRAQGC